METVWDDVDWMTESCDSGHERLQFTEGKEFFPEARTTIHGVMQLVTYLNAENRFVFNRSRIQVSVESQKCAFSFEFWSK
jgi:hypothetical protein